MGGVLSDLWLALVGGDRAGRLGMARLPAVVRHTYFLLVVVDWLGDVPGRDDEGGRVGIPEGDGGNERRPVTATALVLLHRGLLRRRSGWRCFTRTHGAGQSAAGACRSTPATASLLMMLAATGLFVWRPGAVVLQAIRNLELRIRNS